MLAQAGWPGACGVSVLGYSETIWTRSLAADSRWPCVSRRLGQDDLQQSLATSALCYSDPELLALPPFILRGIWAVFALI